MLRVPPPPKIPMPELRISKYKDGGPAFPVMAGGALHDGMTLRDYFAAKAMQGMYASDTENWNSSGHENMRAEMAYEMADAMLAAREQKQ